MPEKSGCSEEWKKVYNAVLKQEGNKSDEAKAKAAKIAHAQTDEASGNSLWDSIKK
jgi:hypothetical protein